MNFEAQSQSSGVEKRRIVPVGETPKHEERPRPSDMPEDWRAHAREILIDKNASDEQKAWAKETWAYEGYRWDDANPEQSAAETLGILRRSPESKVQKEWRAEQARKEEQARLAKEEEMRRQIEEAEERKRAQIRKETLEASPLEQRIQVPEPKPQGRVQKFFGRLFG